MYCWEIVNTPLELLSFLLHCNASNLVREILKQQNMGGAISISVAHSKFWGLHSPCPPLFTPMAQRRVTYVKETNAVVL